MNSVEVVIPIGPGDPLKDAPVSELLEFGFSNLKYQTQKVKITCAVDEGLKPQKLDLIGKYADKIVMFPTNSYFRPGGIWNKIYTCWESSDCEFVTWNGYDDYSSTNRFELQSEEMKKRNSKVGFCSIRIDNNGTVSNAHNGHVNFPATLGGHAEVMGGFLYRKDYITNCGIDRFRSKWVYYFEGLLNLYSSSQKNIAVSSDAYFVYRAHAATISNTGMEHKEWVRIAREDTKYTEQDCRNDWASINFNHLTHLARIGTLY